jgi:ribonuclease BN (tRNA processing enzyme)
MPIRVLGCSGSIAAGSRTTSFLLDHDVLIDAGTGVGDLTLEEMARIDHIFISHSHLDHVLAIGLLADSVMRLRRAAGKGPVLVHALAPTIEALHRHIFNGVIWPDFTALPEPSRPVLRFVPFVPGERIALGARCIEVLPALHTVPAVGFAVWPNPDAQGPAWVYTGDTGPNPALWRRLQHVEVGQLVIETAFRDEEHELAERSAHLNPSRLNAELAQLAGTVDVYITHIKPGEVDAVMGAIRSHGVAHRIHGLTAGQLMTLPAGT